MPARPKKPQTNRQALLSEHKALLKQKADDKRIIEKAALKLARDARREIDRLNAIAKKATAGAAAAQLRYDKAASRLAKSHGQTNKSLLQRLGILEARITAL